MVPTAHELGRIGRLDDHPHTLWRDTFGRNPASGGHAHDMHTGSGRDEEEAQLIAQDCETRIVRGITIDVDLGVEWRADHALLTQALKLARHGGARADQS